MLKEGLYAFVPQQERRPGKFRTPPQHVLKEGLYAFVPQQERRPGKFRTPLQQVLKEGLYRLNPHTAVKINSHFSILVQIYPHKNTSYKHHCKFAHY